MNPTTFVRSFFTGIRNGKCPTTVVEQMAKRHQKTPNWVWNYLRKQNAAFCFRLNGGNIWFPAWCPPTSQKNWKKTEFNFWQWAVQYGLQQGWITPSQVKAWTPNQVFHHLCNCFSRNYTRPRGFNPNTRVRQIPVPFSTPTRTTARKSKPKSKAKRRPARKTRRPSTHGLRLVGSSRSYGFGRRTVGARRKAA